jgi:mRNA-degrading endonuclease RelE of RelBE toxin-antitoxin system
MNNKIFSEIKKLPEFKKDFKKLLKKFRTLDEDLNNFIKTQLNLYHKLKQDNRGIFQIDNIDITYPKIYKAKKFTCKSLKGRGAKSGVRIIYAYYENENIIELIEIYFKGKQTNENRERIIEHYKQHNNP